MKEEILKTFQRLADLNPQVEELIEEGIERITAEQVVEYIQSQKFKEMHSKILKLMGYNLSK